MTFAVTQWKDIFIYQIMFSTDLHKWIRDVHQDIQDLVLIQLPEMHPALMILIQSVPGPKDKPKGVYPMHPNMP